MLSSIIPWFVEGPAEAVGQRLPGGSGRRKGRKGKEGGGGGDYDGVSQYVAAKDPVLILLDRGDTLFLDTKPVLFL